MAIKVGSDEFCSKCMEWREYDAQGKCKVCGKVIKKILKNQHKEGQDDYTTETPSFEPEDEVVDDDY
jgi:PHP family Zn ribbon phosphoesterase